MNKIKINSLLRVLSIITFIGIISTDSVLGQINKQNCLYLKGKILDGYSANIELFEYNNIKKEWVSILTEKNKKKYNIKVDPLLNYQIYFKNNHGQVKVLHIDSGKRGLWFKYVDIDFNQKNLCYAKIHQSAKKADYDITSVSDDCVKEKVKIVIKDNPYKCDDGMCIKNFE